MPRTLAVVGEGVIGIEYATIFSALDVKVTLIDPAASVLPFVDQELVDEFVHDLRDRGVTLRLKSKVSRIERSGDGACVVHLEDGRQVRSEMVLYAAGRQGAMANPQLPITVVVTPCQMLLVA